MHRVLVLGIVVGGLGCGPMYAQPGGQPPPPQQPPQQPPPAQPDPEGPPETPPVASPVAPPVAPPVAYDAPRAQFSMEAQEWVDAHNRVRAKHCAAPLAWAPKLAEVAQRWANSLRDHGCGFEHTPNNAYGENLAAGTIGTLGPASTVDYWYSEIKAYNFSGGGFSMDTGHFTQEVWRGTTSVGCGHAQCNGNDLYVCEYDPPGNYDGEYAENVRPLGCK